MRRRITDDRFDVMQTGRDSCSGGFSAARPLCSEGFWMDFHTPAAMQKQTGAARARPHIFGHPEKGVNPGRHGGK